MSSSSFSTRGQELESSLKDLLQTVIGQILLYLENFIDNQEDLKLIEVELRDYEDLHELIKIIKTVFGRLTAKVDAKIGQRRFQIPQKKSNEYEKLESLIQKYEGEIRQHIRNEHQMKIYADQLQQQLEDQMATHKKFVIQTTKRINVLLSENQRIQEENQRKLPAATQPERSKHQSVSVIKEAPRKSYDSNQVTENAAVSQVSTNLGGLTNCESTPLKLVRAQQSSNRNLNELLRNRGTSMSIKRDFQYLEQQKTKSHSLALSKHNSQENSIEPPKKSHNNSSSGRPKRNITSEATHRKQKHFKDWQATLLRKCQIK